MCKPNAIITSVGNVQALEIRLAINSCPATIWLIKSSLVSLIVEDSRVFVCRGSEPVFTHGALLGQIRAILRLDSLNLVVISVTYIQSFVGAAVVDSKGMLQFSTVPFAF